MVQDSSATDGYSQDPHNNRSDAAPQPEETDIGMPHSIVKTTLVTYRAVGIGIFGGIMRYVGMPLEKIALYLNSSQVSGKNQFRQALRLTFAEGPLAPYKVVGPASLTAWFFQYSVMGFAFQFFDHGLSNLLGVKPVFYGAELMQPPPSKISEEEAVSFNYRMKSTFKTMLSPILAAAMETMVSNRAEAQRFFGQEQFAKIERTVYSNHASATKYIRRAVGLGVAFEPCMMRNLIMCQTTFVLTPVTYKLYFPQEHKSKSSLFWYGLGTNIFVGNIVAITQQALWGRSLDYLGKHGEINYGNVIRQGLEKEGTKAFFTAPKWFGRVLMNAPAQGVLPWFYNEILPFGEEAILSGVKNFVYQPFFRNLEMVDAAKPIETVGGIPERTSYTYNEPR